MRKLIKHLVFGAIISAPFLLYVFENPVQSYPDFFIKGVNNALSSFFSWSPQNFGINVSSSIWRLFPLGVFYVLFTNVIELNSGLTQLLLCSFIFGISYVSYCKAIPRLIPKFNLSSSAIKISGLLYLFNPYTLIQLTNSFLLVIPYLLIPLQILLLFRAFESKKIYQYSVLLAFINAACFGINLIFDVLSAIILIFISISVLHFRDKIPLKKIIIFFGTCYSLTLLLCSFWLIPQLYSSLSDPVTSQFVLKSEQFYNSDSSMTNVLRGLGDWSFFSVQKGIPYNSFAEAYNSNPFVILSGFLIFFIALASIFFYRRRPSEKKQIVVLLGLLTICQVIMVGTYKGFLTAELAAKVFESVPFAMAFRNTYKFGMIEMLIFSLLFAITLSVLLKRFSGPAKWTIMAGTFSIICVNAFPFFTQQLYSSNTLIKEVPTYWREAATYINNQKNNDQNYIFMLPNQYFEALKWEGMLKTFPRNIEETLFKPPVVHNTCRGCGQFLTSNFITYAYENLTSTHIFKLLGLTGNSTVIQRNDYDSEYYDVETPPEIKNILSKNQDVKPAKSIGKLDIYDIDRQFVNPLIYSPDKVVATNTIEAFLPIMSQNNKSTSIALTDTIHKNDDLTLRNSNYFQPVFNEKTSEVEGSNAISKIHTPREDSYKLFNDATEVNYRVGYKSVEGAYTLTLQRLDSVIAVNDKLLSSEKGNTISLDLGSYGMKSIIVELNNRTFLLEPDKNINDIGSFSFSSSENSLKVFLTDNLKDNLAINGSLENGLWQSKVGNCAQSTDNADIKMERIKNKASEGTNSLLLSSTQDTACTFTPPIDNFQPGSYYFSFDSKHTAGSQPSYCVWDGKQCVAFSKLNSAKGWVPYSQGVYLDSSAANFYLYLYAQKNNTEQTRSEYDNVKIYRLTEPVKTLTYTLPPVNNLPLDLDLGKGEQTLSTNIELSPTNLLENGDFEDGSWQKEVQNCTDQNGVTSLGMKIITDEKYGNALELSTDGSSSACTNSAYIGSYTKGNTYALSYKYRITKGRTAKMCIWNGQACISTKTLSASDQQWHSASELVVSDQGFQPLSVYLYAPEGEPAEVAYTDIDIRQVENSFVNSYTISNKGLHKITPAGITFEQKTPTRFNVNVKTEDLSLVVLSQSYHPKWNAYAVRKKPKTFTENIKWSLGLWDRYRIPDSNHTIANGFSNGWWIDPNKIPGEFRTGTGEYNLVVDYGPQKFVIIGLIISIITVGGSIIYLATVHLNPKNKSRRWHYAKR